MNLEIYQHGLLLFPLMGFLINGFLYNKDSPLVAGVVGTASVFLSFVCALILFLKLKTTGAVAIEWTLMEWITVEDLAVNFTFSFNRVSALMALVITGVGSLIHFFSIEYMAEDERPFKYFSYLNLFILNMLVLVLSNNLLVTFVGWEGVGLCSYLLIGFWFEDAEGARAGCKAFIINRIGDIGLLVGIFLLSLHTGSFDYALINEAAPSLVLNSWFSIPNLAVFSLFVGVSVKSAQIPFHVWLPSSTVGPVPISVLIHAVAATTAGVYLLFRLNGLLMSAPEAMQVIAYVGAFTALLGAFIALSEWDLKKVLAYSSVSQLGYMVMAIGIGSFGGAIFHLVAHAFFKSLLFLGAGSVINGMHGEQDMRKMGGLKEHLKITYISFIVGWLSLMGAPLFSGFFSRNKILFHSLVGDKGSVFLWLIGLLTAVLTAFYMTRLMALIFWVETKEKNAPRDGGLLVNGSLLALSAFSILAGLLGLPYFFKAIFPSLLLSDWLSPMVLAEITFEGGAGIEFGLMLLSIFLVMGSAWTAYQFYVKGEERVGRALSLVHRSPLLKWSDQRLFFDQFYKSKVVNPFLEITDGLWKFIEDGMIDRFMNFFSTMVYKTNSVNKLIQNGKIQTYIFSFVFGTSMILVFLLWF